MNDELFDFYKNALSGVLSDPLCAEYRDEWRASSGDKERLVALSLRQQSIPFFAHYCSEGKALDEDYILRNFSDYINGYTILDADGVYGYTYGLYVDWDSDNDLVVDKNVSHVMWTTDATLLVPKTKCPIIYLSTNSNIHLVCDGYNYIKVYMFDKSVLTIDDCDNSTSVVVYKYDRRCDVRKGRYCICDKIHEHEKELRL